MSDLDMDKDDFAEMVGDLVRVILSDDLEALQTHLDGISSAELRRMKSMAYAVIGTIEALGGGSE